MPQFDLQFVHPVCPNRSFGSCRANQWLSENRGARIYRSYSRARGVLDPGGNRGGAVVDVLARGSSDFGFSGFEEVPAFPDLTMFLRGGMSFQVIEGGTKNETVKRDEFQESSALPQIRLVVVQTGILPRSMKLKNVNFHSWPIGHSHLCS